MRLTTRYTKETMSPLNPAFAPIFPPRFSFIDSLSRLWCSLKRLMPVASDAAFRQPSRWHPWPTGKLEKQPVGVNHLVRRRTGLFRREPEARLLPAEGASLHLDRAFLFHAHWFNAFHLSLDGSPPSHGERVEVGEFAPSFSVFR